MNQKMLKIMGWIATCTAMLMYVSYFPQIVNNIHGSKSGFFATHGCNNKLYSVG